MPKSRIYITSYIGRYLQMSNELTILCLETTIKSCHIYSSNESNLSRLMYNIVQYRMHVIRLEKLLYFLLQHCCYRGISILDNTYLYASIQVLLVLHFRNYFLFIGVGIKTIIIICNS